jgi:hypothetical protein
LLFLAPAAVLVDLRGARVFVAGAFFVAVFKVVGFSVDSSLSG